MRTCLSRAPFLLSAIVGTALCAQPPRPARELPATLILTRGKVFTADAAHPWAEAIAIRGERILRVGTATEIEALAGPTTRRIELGGRTVVPGFNDAHSHLGLSAVSGVRVVIDPSPTPDPPLAAVLDSLAAAARRAPAGTWLSSYIGARVFDDPSVTRAILDSAVPLHPVWLRGWWGHGVVANTAALQALGLLDTRDPSGGWLSRDERGTPTGRVDEYAIFNVEHRFGVAHGDSLLALDLRAHADAGLRLGITTIQDMATLYDLALARAAARRWGATRARQRIVRFPTTDPPGGRLAERRISGADTALAPTMHISGVKWILDGTPIERLALLRQPYADRPGWYGRANFSLDTLRAILRDALARGEQPVLHAVGDSTIALVIRAMRAEAPDSAWRRLRPRLEHADGLGRDQLADVKALGIVVVQNPSHLALPQLITGQWGGDRLRSVNLMRTLVDSGVPLALGSDGVREPGLNIMFATLHPNVPSEALTREQAVVAYTRGSAYAEFAEREKGTLAAGMLADVVVLSQDIFAVPAQALPATTSVLTLVGGQIVHDRLTAAAPSGVPPR